MQIISSKQFLFQDIEYFKDTDPLTGKEVIVHKVNKSIIVVASEKPQVVPDWVKNDPLFDYAVDDGSIVEIAIKSKAPQQKPSTNLKGIKQDAQTPVAAFADGSAADSNWGKNI